MVGVIGKKKNIHKKGLLLSLPRNANLILCFFLPRVKFRFFTCSKTTRPAAHAAGARARQPDKHARRPRLLFSAFACLPRLTPRVDAARSLHAAIFCLSPPRAPAILTPFALYACDVSSFFFCSCS
jgi:hypothetical protein